MSEKEKRKNEMVAKPRYMVLKILVLIIISLILLQILSAFTQNLGIYPLQVLPSAISTALWQNFLFTGIYGILNPIVYCFIALICSWIERGFYGWRRAGYITANIFLTAVIFIISLFIVVVGLQHETSISLNNQRYHLASRWTDIGADYYFYGCDFTGLVCTDKEDGLSRYMGENEIANLRISEDGKSIEITASYYGDIPRVIFTYTPETAGAE